MPGDLHTHTTYSDGSTPVAKLPFLARCAGMTHLAISDHDSIQSVRYAYAHPVQDGGVDRLRLRARPPRAPFVLLAR